MAGTPIPGSYAFDADDRSIQSEEHGVLIAPISEVEDFPCRETDQDAQFEADLVASGHVLAAAPDLLSALRLFDADLARTWSGPTSTEAVRGMTPSRREAWKAAQAAIAKAEARA